MKVYLRHYDPKEAPHGWQEVTDDGDVREGTITVVTTGGRDRILTRVGGIVCAVDGECPHRAGSLAKGIIVEGNIRCPVHGYEFDLLTGRGIGNDETLETIRTRVANENPQKD